MCISGGRLPVWEGGSITWYKILHKTNVIHIKKKMKYNSISNLIKDEYRMTIFINFYENSNIISIKSEECIRQPFFLQHKQNLSSTDLSQAGAWFRQSIFRLDRVMVGVRGETLGILVLEFRKVLNCSMRMRRLRSHLACVRIRGLRARTGLPILDQYRHCNPV